MGGMLSLELKKGDRDNNIYVFPYSFPNICIYCSQPKKDDYAITFSTTKIVTECKIPFCETHLQATKINDTLKTNYVPVFSLIITFGIVIPTLYLMRWSTDILPSFLLSILAAFGAFFWAFLLSALIIDSLIMPIIAKYITKYPVEIPLGIKSVTIDEDNEVINLELRNDEFKRSFMEVNRLL